MGQYFTNDNSIPSKLVKTRAVVLNNSFIFYTDNGVFSKDGLDFGSRLLLENIPLTEIGESLLDVGCGYGVFGIILNIPILIFQLRLFDSAKIVSDS